ncbi:hypothetical protein FF1_018549 [Malus domestica]
MRVETLKKQPQILSLSLPNYSPRPTKKAWEISLFSAQSMAASVDAAPTIDQRRRQNQPLINADDKINCQNPEANEEEDLYLSSQPNGHSDIRDLQAVKTHTPNLQSPAV